MRVFFNSQEIIEGPSAPVKRAIKRRLKGDPHLKYKFSGPFSELECCMYDLRSGLAKWAWEHYDYATLDTALTLMTAEVQV